VLVVDYSMPGMNGIQVCRAVRDLPCRRILLTGAADERIAIDAFNRGLIDLYIRKSDHDALERLDAELALLQRRWFLEQAAALRSLLPLHGYGFIDDPAVAALFGQTVEHLHIVEHYLVHAPGGFLLLDREGKSWLLVIETEQTMQSHLEMAHDSGAPPSLLAALEERLIIPDFSAGDGMYSHAFGKDWYRYTAPARVCDGGQRYYWALFETRQESPRQAAGSFADFLRSA
jgi:CheY-like chemotaxis protein